MGLPEFFLKSDGVGQGLFALLWAMSMASWYLIAVKAWQGRWISHNNKVFLKRLWNARSSDEAAQTQAPHSGYSTFARLAAHAFNASGFGNGYGKPRWQEPGIRAEHLTRTLRRAIDEETARLEWGLTTLASIASTAPFVGLFGTVWGVYHALANIGKNGQGTLDQIAGPVGEALIMTGLGLAVAIPAVLAYNDCSRSNRLLLAELDSFAYDLFHYLTARPDEDGQTGER